MKKSVITVLILFFSISICVAQNLQDAIRQQQQQEAQQRQAAEEQKRREAQAPEERKRREAQEIVKKNVIRVEVIRDTVLDNVQQLAEIEKSFNAVQFAQGRSELKDEAKFVLHDLARLLTSHPEMKVRIIDHTSREGAEDVNQRLSEARAKATVDFLVKERNIDPSRLEFKGAGSSQPIDPDQLDINRRTEFVVIE